MKPLTWTTGPSIDFPTWATITKCESRSRSRFLATRHGFTRFVLPELTDHGRTMAAYRVKEMARATPTMPIHRTRHWGRLLAS